MGQSLDNQISNSQVTPLPNLIKLTRKRYSEKNRIIIWTFFKKLNQYRYRYWYFYSHQEFLVINFLEFLTVLNYFFTYFIIFYWFKY